MLCRRARVDRARQQARVARHVHAAPAPGARGGRAPPGVPQGLAGVFLSSACSLASNWSGGR